jgi:hypothetical protein
VSKISLARIASLIVWGMGSLGRGPVALWPFGPLARARKLVLPWTGLDQSCQLIFSKLPPPTIAIGATWLAQH